MNRNVLAAALAAVLISVASSPALADGHEAKINAYIDSHIRGWLGSAEIIAAVDQQNINHFGITAGEIERLDQRWRKERNRLSGSLISSVMGNQLSAFLRGIKAASGDFMQGDEDKWQKTYPVSAHAVFIDAVEEDGGVNVSQTSLTVARSNDARLGAVTIGINVDALK